MFRVYWWSYCVLLGAYVVFAASMASAQDPFDAGRSGLAERGVNPAAPARQAPGSEKSVLASEVPGAKQAIEHDAHTHDHTHDFCRCVGESESAAVARIEKVLNGPLRSNGLDFTDTPLEEVVNLLQEEYGIPIQLDVPALESAGLNQTEKITANLHNISLGSALRLMLKKLQLTYIISEEVLLITTPEEADANLRICVYNVRGFVEDTSDASMEALIDTIVSCVETASWAENGGGEAEIRPLRSGLLVISQTQDVHEQINSLLKAIRDMREEGGVAGRGPDDVVTRLYALQVNGNAEKLGGQVREMIIQSIPDAQWDGRLPDGQSVTLTVLADRVIVRQRPAVQEKVENLLRDSGVATPARASDINRDRRSGAQPDAETGKRSGDGKGVFFIPPVHEPRVSG
jgi:hypothetical protein